MKVRIHKDLERAKVLCHAGDLLASYTLLKRYFDRLPFALERAHSETISMFVWCLSELGRENDLKFYVDQLERLRRKNETPDILYQLGVLSTTGRNANHKVAKDLLSHALKLSTDVELTARIQMSLAFIYDRTEGNDAAIQMLVESIPEVQDPYLRIAIALWKGIVRYRKGETSQAEGLFAAVENLLCEYPDWYLGFILDLVRASLYFKSGEVKRGLPFLDSARKKVSGKSYKVSLMQLGKVEDYLRPKPTHPHSQVHFDANNAYLNHASPGPEMMRKLPLETDSAVRKLLNVLAREERLSKASIVEALYARPYLGERDDKLIYYHVHNLRKFFKRLGVPGETLSSDMGGYTLTAGVSLKKESI